MKSTISIFILALSLLTFSQSSKTIFNDVGVNVNYKYENIGTVENPETGTTFYKYKFTLTIVNSTSKFYDISASARFDVLKVSTTSKSDGNFVWNNGIGADLNFNYYTGPGKCTNYENDGRARLFVICPNGVSEMEGTFVYPQSFGNNPPIRWNNIYVNEIKGNSLNTNSNSNKSTSSNLNQTIKTKRTPSEEIKKKWQEKMLIVFGEIGDILTEVDYSEDVKIYETNGSFRHSSKYFICKVRFKFDGCNGKITEISTTGENAAYNNIIKNKINELQNKYKVVNENYCFQQIATMTIGE